jgi:hypothetical protein
LTNDDSEIQPHKVENVMHAQFKVS